MEILTKSDAIKCALNEGLDQLRKHLQESANTTNGGVLSETDKKFLDAAESFMKNESSLEIAREFQRQISWDGDRIRTLENEIDKLNETLKEYEKGGQC